jgi:hypothetical protein
MQLYFYPIYPVPYWYNHHVPMVKYAQNPPTNPSMWDKLTPYVPYFQAAGIGVGIGALGGVGISALWGTGGWKRVLRSALIGMVTGAIAGPALYAGYSRFFPGQTAQPAQPKTPVVVRPTQPKTPAAAPPDSEEPLEPEIHGPKIYLHKAFALKRIQEDEELYKEWERQGRPTDSASLGEIFRTVRKKDYTVFGPDT